MASLSVWDVWLSRHVLYGHHFKNNGRLEIKFCFSRRENFWLNRDSVSTLLPPHVHLFSSGKTLRDLNWNLFHFRFNTNCMLLTRKYLFYQDTDCMDFTSLLVFFFIISAADWGIMIFHMYILLGCESHFLFTLKHVEPNIFTPCLQ